MTFFNRKEKGNPQFVKDETDTQKKMKHLVPELLF